MKKKQLKCYIYIRVSTSIQDGSESQRILAKQNIVKMKLEYKNKK